MLNEFNALERPIAQTVARCRSLREENTQLRQQLAAAEAEKKRLADRMDTARERLEQLAQRLPEGETATL